MFSFKKKSYTEYTVGLCSDFSSVFIKFQMFTQQYTKVFIGSSGIDFCVIR